MARTAPQRVRDAVRGGAYRLTGHAEREREADTILLREIEEAFGSRMPYLLENYPDDPRGPSALFLGFTTAGKALHAVIGLSGLDIIVFVTLYRPDPSLWRDWRTRV